MKTPLIHDITTDTENPPLLQAAALIRSKYQNSVIYEGARIAHLQRVAYPEIQPVISSLEPTAAFSLARSLVDSFGWETLAENSQAGTIEAVAITPFLRFRDDVSIRITNNHKGSRMDIRSASRLGVSDFGTNARRIGQFIKRFIEVTGQSNKFS